MAINKGKSNKSSLLREAILSQIYNGELQKNDKISSCRDMCKIYGLSYVTVNKVVKELCQDGILKTVSGIGTIVKSTDIQDNKKTRRILLYDEVIPENIWKKLISQEDRLKDVFYPKFVSNYSALLSKESLSYRPDFFYVSDELIETMVMRKLIQPLNQVIEKFSIDLDKYPAHLLEPFTFDNQIYGLPVCFSTLSLFYNKDMFDAAGLDYPDDSWTWEDLLSAAKKLTIGQEDKMQQFGFAPFADKSIISNFFLQGISDLSVPESEFFKKENTAGLDFLLGLFKKEEVAPTPQESESFVADLFTGGKVAMTISKYHMVRELERSQFKWGIANLPAGKSQCNYCAIQGFALSSEFDITALHVEQMLALTGPNMQKLLFEYFGHIPVFSDLAEKTPHSEKFINQLQYIRYIYLNTAENYSLIKNMIFQFFCKMISSEEVISKLKSLYFKEKQLSKSN